MYERRHLYYVRGINHHKIKSVISNVSGTANQLLTTRQISKIKSITNVRSVGGIDSNHAE